MPDRGCHRDCHSLGVTACNRPQLSATSGDNPWKGKCPTTQAARGRNSENCQSGGRGFKSRRARDKRKHFGDGRFRLSPKCTSICNWCPLRATNSCVALVAEAVSVLLQEIGDGAVDAHRHHDPIAEVPDPRPEVGKGFRGWVEQELKPKRREDKEKAISGALDRATRSTCSLAVGATGGS
jgi:hypothetical protein